METIRPSDRETFKENGNGHHIGARNWLILLAPQVGLEPTTLRLTAECSAIELLRNVWHALLGRT